MPLDFRLAAAGLLILAVPAMAQQSADPGDVREPLPYDRGYDKPDARTDAINAQNRGKVAAANQAAAAQGGPYIAADKAAQAQYETDMAAYRANVAQYRRDLVDNEVHYMRQQRAYADAMMAWRIQTEDCRDGIYAACRAPAPVPADFY